MKLKTQIAMFIFAGFSSLSHAGQVEELIKKNVSEAIGNSPIEKISKSSYGDLYEIITPQGIAYTDKTGSFVIFNSVIIDSKSKENLTEKRIAEISAFKFSDLPFKDAIKIVHGNGKRVLVTVEDPNCGFCKKLQAETEKLKDVTIYTFLIPILGEDSVTKSRSIMCSKDKASVWLSWMRDNKSPESLSDCETPLERNTILAKKLRINGTPAILFASGERIPGYTTVDKIEEKMKTN